MRNLIALLMAAAALAGCVREGPDPFAGYEGGISCQRPRAPLRYTEPRGKDSLLVDGLEKFRQRKPLFLDSLAAECPSAADRRGAEWGLMGAFDAGDEGIHVVYFLRYQHDRMMAGRRVHLCFDRERSLKKVYVYEVPLE